MQDIIYLGRYQPIRLIGEGGMGQVYFGRQLQPPPREVVIKVMHERIAGTPRARERFEREMGLMSRLQHPNIVQIIDSGANGTHRPCLVMEFLKGVTLEALRRRERRFDPVRVGRWLVQLCSALHAAHGAGIVHRDLKPENLMVLDADTPRERIKVMDFGLAHLSDVPHIALEKLNGTCRHIGGGTPDYLPPEQVRKDSVDHRGDIYTVGVMLFQLLTGRLPFSGKSAADVMLAHVEQPPPRFADVAFGLELPAGLEQVVRGCLAKYPNERIQSAQKLAEAYEKALGGKLIEPGMFPASAKAPASPVSVLPEDPHAIKHQLEAWMPESIAVVKLRGFAEDNGGQVVESVPGLIRIRFRDAGSAPAPPKRGLLSWMAKSPTPPPASITEMELRMQKKETERQNLLLLTIFIRPHGDRGRLTNRKWLEFADELFRNLRAYLMGRR